jgi:hypothetical protein
MKLYGLLCTGQRKQLRVHNCCFVSRIVLNSVLMICVFNLHKSSWGVVSLKIDLSLSASVFPPVLHSISFIPH